MPSWSPYKMSLREKIAGWILGEPIWELKDRVNTDGFIEGFNGYVLRQINEPVLLGEIPAVSISQLMMSWQEDNWIKVEFYAKRESK